MMHADVSLCRALHVRISGTSLQIRLVTCMNCVCLEPITRRYEATKHVANVDLCQCQNNLKLLLAGPDGIQHPWAGPQPCSGCVRPGGRL